MARRPSSYRRAEIVKLLQAAGWEARQGAEGHTVLAKDGKRAFTLTDPPHKNVIAEIQKELGLHISQLIVTRRGKFLDENQIRQRLLLGQQLWRAGFTGDYLTKVSGLRTFYLYGFSITDLNQPVEEIARRIRDAMLAKKGVKVRRPPPEPAKPIIITPKTDTDAMAKILASIEQRLEFFSRTDRLSLLGDYLERLQATLADMRSLKPLLEKQLEICNRILERLER